MHGRSECGAVISSDYFHPRITHSGVTARHLLVGETIHSAPLLLNVTRNDLRSLLVGSLAARREKATASPLGETETDGLTEAAANLEHLHRQQHHDASGVIL